MSVEIQHLILVRHGESEGDQRRAAWMRGEALPTAKLPEHEEVTDTGIEQSRQAGLWIRRHVLQAYKLTAFDGSYVSSAVRSLQSAVAMELPEAVWQVDGCLDERGRGRVRGLKAEQHRQRFPDSFKHMQADPLHWLPPAGEALIPDVGGRAGRFMENIDDMPNVLAVTHRDWMWAAQLILEQLSETELLAVDTDAIHNAQVVEYTSVHPLTGEQAPALLWKRSVDPTVTDGPGEWQILPHVAELYPLAA